MKPLHIFIVVLVAVMAGEVLLVYQSSMLVQQVKRFDVHRSQKADREVDVTFMKILYLVPDIDKTLAKRIAAITVSSCRLYGQDLDLVLAMIKVESDFDPTQVSSAGAIGLMQLMPNWKTIFKISEPMDVPEVNIDAGVRVLSLYRQVYGGDLEVALTAYNSGPSKVDWDLIRERKLDTSYAKLIMEQYNKLLELQL